MSLEVGACEDISGVSSRRPGSEQLVERRQEAVVLLRGCRRSRAASPPRRAPRPRARSRPARPARAPPRPRRGRPATPRRSSPRCRWCSRPRSASPVSTCMRSTAVRSTRRSTSSWWPSASAAAAWASALTENGWRTRSTREPEVLRAERVARPQPAEAVDLGEGAEQDQVGVPLEQVERLVGVLERRELHVGLVEDHRHVARAGRRRTRRSRPAAAPWPWGCSGCRRSRCAWRR